MGNARYERATGVIEIVRECLACGHIYRSQKPDMPTKCPKCGSDKTRDKDGARRPSDSVR